MEFKRKVYDKMVKWKKEYAPNYALFLKGARRVGKSTLALKLGKEEYKSFIEIRFDKAPNEIKDLFVNSLEDLDYLFNKLQIFYKTRLYVRESLIILDEIQLFPEARQALKTLLEDKRYDFVETGSLASITKKSKDILIPSEEYTIEVLPMDFEEFMWAMNDDITIDIIKEHYNDAKKISLARHVKRHINTYSYTWTCYIICTNGKGRRLYVFLFMVIDLLLPYAGIHGY
jgi:predicted AAA+ superfamily ATPase